MHSSGAASVQARDLLPDATVEIHNAASHAVDGDRLEHPASDISTHVAEVTEVTG